MNDDTLWCLGGSTSALALWPLHRVSMPTNIRGQGCRQGLISRHETATIRQCQCTSKQWCMWAPFLAKGQGAGVRFQAQEGLEILLGNTGKCARAPVLSGWWSMAGSSKASSLSMPVVPSASLATSTSACGCLRVGVRARRSGP